MRVLVTGGAGYIGSFMVRTLIERDYDVTVYDSLERGYADVVDKRANLVRADIKDAESLETLFKNEKKFDAIMHFAGYISVEESTKRPEEYYQNNVTGSENLFSCAVETGNIRNFIFSSSAAVYGNPQSVPIGEDHPKNPTSEYGKNKLAVEEILHSMRDRDGSISFAALRYFNAAGAALNGEFGEMHNPETHIIPLAIRAAIEGSKFNLYGTDYDTPDGTCMRDYIHVLDLVEAHILALDKIRADSGEYYYNVGAGKGYSNLEVVQTIERVANKKVNVIKQERRAGDPDRLIADPSRINSELGFNPKYSDLATIIESAWAWHRQ